MKNLKTTSLIAIVAICVLSVISLVTTDDFNKLKAFGDFGILECGMSLVILFYFLLHIGKNRPTSLIVIVVASGVIGGVLWMGVPNQEEIDNMRHIIGNRRNDVFENVAHMATLGSLFMFIFYLGLMATMGTLLSFAKTKEMKWVIYGLIVVSIIRVVLPNVAVLSKPEYDHLPYCNDADAYRTALEIHETLLMIFTKIVGILFYIGWILFIYFQSKETAEPQVEIGAGAVEPTPTNPSEE